MKKILNKKGYTLIELLAVIILLVTVGTIITAILATSLRSGNKSNTVTDVRQSGNYVIAQMSKMITFARSFDGVSTNGISYVTNCIVNQPPAPTPSIAPVAYSYLKITSFDGGQTTFSCNNGNIASNGANLINSSSMRVSYCEFYCSQTNLTGGPSVDIRFTITKQNAGFFVENNTTINFNTSVTPRNF